MANGNTILNQLSNKSGFDIIGIKSLPDSGDIWEVAVGGQSRRRMTFEKTPTKTIPGVSGTLSEGIRRKL